jgi:hypothetical protein
MVSPAGPVDRCHPPCGMFFQLHAGTLQKIKSQV